MISLKKLILVFISCVLVLGLYLTASHGCCLYLHFWALATS